MISYFTYIMITLYSCPVVSGLCHMAKYTRPTVLYHCKAIRRKREERKVMNIGTRGREQWMEENNTTSTLLSKG